MKGEPNYWAIRGDDATSGDLSSLYDGVRPEANGYNPMSKEGAIILGTAATTVLVVGARSSRAL